MAAMNGFSPSSFFSSIPEEFLSLFIENQAVWSALGELSQLVFSKKNAARIPSLVQADQPELVFVGEGVVFEPNVYIQGACVLGAGSVVRHGAYLRGGVFCGERCVIGHASEVKRTLLMRDVHIAHHVYIGDSILGNNVNLGAGVKCANLRLDRKEVFVHLGKEKIATGMKKLGCVLGDGCQVGCNSVLNPGTLLGPGCIVFPLSTVFGAISANMQIRNRSAEMLCSSRERRE